MDITSILGVIIGTVLIVFVGISPAKLGNFWDGPSIAIVLGGTIAAAIASYPFGRLKTLLKHTKILYQGKKYNIGALIDTLPADCCFQSAPEPWLTVPFYFLHLLPRSALILQRAVLTVPVWKAKAALPSSA